MDQSEIRNTFKNVETDDIVDLSINSGPTRTYEVDHATHHFISGSDIEVVGGALLRCKEDDNLPRIYYGATPRLTTGGPINVIQYEEVGGKGSDDWEQTERGEVTYLEISEEEDS